MKTASPAKWKLSAMHSDQPPLTARSPAEAFLYLKVTPCDACREGSVGIDENPTIHREADDYLLEFHTTCPSCGSVAAKRFRMDRTSADSSSAVLSLAATGPCAEPSTLIDVGQWLTLHSMMVEEAAREKHKQRARTIRMEAAACIDEALGLYDDPENDLPPASALFRDSTRRRFRERPDLFSRQRLVGLRAKLPSGAAMNSDAGRQEPGESESTRERE